MTTTNLIDLEEVLQDPAAYAGNRRMLATWLITGAFFLLMVSVWLMHGMALDETRRLRTKLGDIETAAAAAANVPADVQQFQKDIKLLEHELIQTNIAAEALGEIHVDWPTAMSAIQIFDRSRLDITLLQQDDLTITIQGFAADDSVVLAYLRHLEQSGHFNRAVIQAINIDFTEDGIQRFETTPTDVADQTPVSYVVVLQLREGRK